MMAMLHSIFALVLTGALLAPTSALAYRCEMDGQVRAACCCRNQQPCHAGGDADEQSSARTKDRARSSECCTVQRSESERDPVELSSSAERLAGPMPAVSVARTAVPFSAHWIIPIGADGPPAAVGPPLFIQHSSLLI